MDFRKALSSPRMVLSALLIILWAALPTPGSGSTNEGLVPSSFLRFPEKGFDHAILVDKSQQKVFIYKKDNISTPVKVYPCSTGENDGKKAKQNDRKTPEGIYFFVHVFEQKELAPIYGARAFSL